MLCCRLVMSVFLIVGRSVGRLNLLKGREVTLPCSISEHLFRMVATTLEWSGQEESVLVAGDFSDWQQR